MSWWMESWFHDISWSNQVARLWSAQKNMLVMVQLSWLALWSLWVQFGKSTDAVWSIDVRISSLFSSHLFQSEQPCMKNTPEATSVTQKWTIYKLPWLIKISQSTLFFVQISIQDLDSLTSAIMKLGTWCAWPRASLANWMVFVHGWNHSTNYFYGHGFNSEALNYQRVNSRVINHQW